MLLKTTKRITSVQTQKYFGNRPHRRIAAAPSSRCSVVLVAFSRRRRRVPVLVESIVREVPGSKCPLPRREDLDSHITHGSLGPHH